MWVVCIQDSALGRFLQMPEIYGVFSPSQATWSPVSLRYLLYLGAFIYTLRLWQLSCLVVDELPWMLLQRAHLFCFLYPQVTPLGIYLVYSMYHQKAVWVYTLAPSRITFLFQQGMQEPISGCILTTVMIRYLKHSCPLSNPIERNSVGLPF